VDTRWCLLWFWGQSLNWRKEYHGQKSNAMCLTLRIWVKIKGTMTTNAESGFCDQVWKQQMEIPQWSTTGGKLVSAALTGNCRYCSIHIYPSCKIWG
jgi:hypothetical protein